MKEVAFVAIGSGLSSCESAETESRSFPVCVKPARTIEGASLGLSAGVVLITEMSRQKDARDCRLGTISLSLRLTNEGGT